MKFIPFILTLILLNSSIYGAGDVTYKNMGKFLKKNEISNQYSYQSTLNLISVINNLIAEVKNDEDLSKKDKKKRAKLLKHALYLAESIIHDDLYDNQKEGNYLKVKRILYATLSLDHEGRKLDFLELVTYLPKFFLRLETHIDYMDYEDSLNPIGLKRAKREAKYLVNPNNPGQFMTLEELSKLSSQEISMLEIGRSHPHWHRSTYLEKKREDDANLWDELEDYVNKSVSKVIGADSSTHYDLKKAKKILFFSKIKDSATSPKINTKDTFGQKWKLKWGPETQTEPILNRLYAHLGAKWADLVYANESGEDGIILILDKKDDGCDKIATLKNFKSCMLKSKYKFAVGPYIKSVGVIDEITLQRFINYSGTNLENIAKEKKLIGRTYITFKTSLVEFNGADIFIRGGSTAGSSLGALEDRVGRGLVIFNSWVSNNDAKDENNKGFLFKNFKGQDEVYIETQHDLGASLGALGRSGDINTLRTKRGFLYTKKGLRGKKLVFDEEVLYRPKAWEKATHADALWMAKKIVSLPSKLLKTSIEASLWPKFMTDTLYYKLMARRERIAKAYNLSSDLDTLNIEKPNYKVDLSLEETRVSLAKKFNFDSIDLEEFAKNHELELKEEYIVRDAEISSCRRSVFINFLEQEVYPEGLSRRQKRARDDRPLSVCRPRRQ